MKKNGIKIHRAKEYSKVKATKIILILSFIPYIFLLFYSIYSSICGFTFFYQTSYGFEGFSDSIVIMGFLLCVYYPIIPVCLLYQIIYLIFNLIKTHKHIQ